MNLKAQASIEYMVIVGFVTFIVLSIFLVAYIYIGILSPKIKINQIETFANKVISSSESIYYNGEPSKVTIDAYLPSGVNSIQINSTFLIINYSTGPLNNVRAYESKINLTGTINPALGIKKIVLEAKSDHVDIHQ